MTWSLLGPTAERRTAKSSVHKGDAVVPHGSACRKNHVRTETPLTLVDFFSLEIDHHVGKRLGVYAGKEDPVQTTPISHRHTGAEQPARRLPPLS